MEYLAKEVYVYCTDFIINLANLLNLSYYEINTILFCILYPSLLIGLSIIYLSQKIRFRKLNSKRYID
jgi:hypothetical protein